MGDRALFLCAASSRAAPSGSTPHPTEWQLAGRPSVPGTRRRIGATRAILEAAGAQIRSNATAGIAWHAAANARHRLMAAPQV